MSLNGRLVSTLFLLLISHWSHGQSIEIFVEPGVEIVGHPQLSNLDGISQNYAGITNDGHVIFQGSSLIEFMPGLFFPVPSILFAEDVNQVDYLIGNGDPLGGAHTLNFGTDRDTDLYFNHKGDYCFRAFLRHNSDSDFDIGNALILGSISNNVPGLEIIDRDINAILQLSEKGNILYSGRDFVANKAALKLASLEEPTILLTELGPLAGNPGSFVWSDEFDNNDDVNARFQESDDPLIGDNVFFARPYLNDFPQSSNVLFDGYAAYVHQANQEESTFLLSISTNAEKLVPYPYLSPNENKIDQYLVWVDASDVPKGFYLQSEGDTIAAGNLIVATNNPTAPLIDPDGRIYFHDTDGGVSRYDPDSENLTKVIEIADIGEEAVDVFGYSDSGLLVLVARNGDFIQSLWTYNPLNSSLKKFLDAETIVEGKTVGNFEKTGIMPRMPCLNGRELYGIGY